MVPGECGDDSDDSDLPLETSANFHNPSAPNTTRADARDQARPQSVVVIHDHGHPRRRKKNDAKKLNFSIKKILILNIIL